MACAALSAAPLRGGGGGIDRLGSGDAPSILLLGRCTSKDLESDEFKVAAAAIVCSAVSEETTKLSN